MERSLTMVILGGLAVVGTHSARAQQPVSPGSALRATSEAGNPRPDLAAIPPLPRGKTTIFGGEVRSIDPVRDQMTLDVFGERPMRILFDERTAVFRDGKRVPLRSFGPTSHASVETTLDGTKLFAVSVHVLSETPDGQYQGRVVGFNPSTGELLVASGRSAEPLRTLVQAGTSIVRTGQSTFSASPSGVADLVRGSLVSVEFGAVARGEAVAKQVEILAVPGSEFVFSGNVVGIDMHSGTVVVMDPDDQQNHEVFVDPERVRGAAGVHLGDRVRVVASYDGMRYVAREFAALEAPQH